MIKRKILITNDDGIYARGIEILINILKKNDAYELFVVAPLHNRSGAGMSFTHRSPVAVRRFSSEPGLNRWVVEGTPVDCTKLGLNVVFEDSLPDLVISGINHGSNAGQNVLYSGTAGAALDAALKGIPALALSQISHIDNFQEELGGTYLEILIDFISSNQSVGPNCLNVNFPLTSTPYKGMILTQPGSEVCIEEPYFVTEDEGRMFYMIGTKAEEPLETPSKEWHSLKEGIITAAPVFPLNLSVTAQKHWEEKQNQFQDFIRRHPLHSKITSGETIV